ncbi:hypothetical protein ABKV19_005835 [Rosa sericea]
MVPGSNEWEKYYQKNFTATPMNGGGIISSDSTGVTTSSSAVVTDQSFISTSPNNGGQLTPTGSVAKPIRRRSRVSKKTPITLLNANANNFRALVQQFTGCAASSTPISFGNQKGPINLSFGVNSAGTSSVVMAPFGNPNYSYNQQQQQQLQRLAQAQQEQQQQRQPLLQLQENHVQLHQEEQQRMYPFDNVSGSDHVFHYSSNSSSSGYNPMQAGMEIGDGFEVMDQEDISLHELLD